MSRNYNIMLAPERVTTLVVVLQDIAENPNEETSSRLLAIQLLMLIGGFELSEVCMPAVRQ